MYVFYSVFASIIVHVASVFVFYFWLDWGFAGICWANINMYITRLIIIFSLVKFGGRFPQPDETEFFSKHTITDICPQLKLNLRATSMNICATCA